MTPRRDLLSEMSQAQRDQVKHFARALRRYAEMNLGATMRRALAVKDARGAHPLPDDEQAAVDRFLAERFPPQKPGRGAALAFRGARTCR